MGGERRGHKVIAGEPRSRAGQARSLSALPAIIDDGINSGDGHVQPMGIGLIGAGNISSQYLKAVAVVPPSFQVKSLADLNHGRRKSARRRIRRDGEVGRRTPRRPHRRHHRQPHGAEGACRGRASGDRRRQAVHSEKPLGMRFRGRQEARRACGEETAAGRLCTGHVPRRRASDLPQADRRGQDRRAGRRHGLLHVPGSRALASEPGFLLSGRRRADARHGPYYSPTS